MYVDDREMVREFGHYIINGSAPPGTASEADRGALRRELQAPAADNWHSDRTGSGHPDRTHHTCTEAECSENYPVGMGGASHPLSISSSPSYVVRSDIPAECIKAHYHPAKIRDFHHDILTYINKAVRCDHCPPAPEPT